MTESPKFDDVAASPELRALIANAIRFLSADAVQAANSGHPGLPMGCADIAAALWTRVLRVDPADAAWFNRDRFVLSAGHGSALIYTMLHFCGYLDRKELADFRQLGSRTPGHPEYGDTPGVDVTGGPLGAGFATAVGLAVAEALLAERYNTAEHAVVDHYTYMLMGDGCLMEGVSNEAASLAGHLGLGKLIGIYDDNEISIEGSTDLAFTENVNARFEALGWHVQDIDGEDQQAVYEAIEAARAVTDRPSLIVAHTTIGRGAPNLAGSHKTHGEPLGADEIAAGKQAIGFPPEQAFYVPAEVDAAFAARREQWAQCRAAWDATFAAYAKAEPAKAAELQAMIDGKLPEGWEKAMPVFESDAKGLATRASGGKVLNAFAAAVPQLVGGSADLAPSNKTEITTGAYPGFMAPGSYAASNIHYGVREHAMGHLANGLCLHGLVGFGATFMVFHDYMRPAVRMAALMNLGTIFVYTHDSIFVGEDGPTHQPVEHLASIRAIPRVEMLRPCDANETAVAWRVAIADRTNPTCLALTRQNLPTLDRESCASAEGLVRGGYVLSGDADAEIALIASGSEVALALDAAEQLRAAGRKVSVVSMPSPTRFARQDKAYRDSVLPPALTGRVVIEAGIIQGWEGILGGEGVFVGMSDFGASGPAAAVAKSFGFTVENVLAQIAQAGF